MGGGFQVVATAVPSQHQRRSAQPEDSEDTGYSRKRNELRGSTVYIRAYLVDRYTELGRRIAHFEMIRGISSSQRCCTAARDYSKASHGSHVRENIQRVRNALLAGMR